MTKLKFCTPLKGANRRVQFFNAKLEVKVKLDYLDYATDKDEYFFFIFNDQLWEMCSSTILESDAHVHRRGMQLSACLSTKFIWMPGRYMLLVADREQLTMRCDFSIAADGRIVDISPMVHCGYDSLEYVLSHTFRAKALSCRVLGWLGGGLQMRRKLIARCQQLVLNEHRRSQGLLELPLTHHALFRIREKTRLGVIGGSLFHMVSPSLSPEVVDCTTLHDATLNNPFENLHTLMNNDDKEQVCRLWNITALCEPGGKIAMSRLVERARSGKIGLVLMGTASELDAVLSQYPSLKAFYDEDNTYAITEFTMADVVQLCMFLADLEQLRLTPEAQHLLCERLCEAYRAGILRGWGEAELRHFVAEHISKPYRLRLIREHVLDAEQKVLPADIDFTPLTAAKSDYEQSLEELRQMVGLEDIKASIATMANRMKFNLWRRDMGLHTTDDVAYHAIFTGSPGTGKTTVARQLGLIYRSLGLLSKGEVIAVDRAKLIGRYIGETEENVKALLEEARGNVLFVDEAYTLYSNADCNDFGKRVIDCLLTVLTQRHPDMLIVFAGYEKEMERLMSLNPGLSGRFPYKYHFPDYTADELMLIAERLLQKDEYVLAGDARQRLRQSIVETLAQKAPDFGNARWVEQYVMNGIVPALADRLSALPAMPGRELCQRIELCDVETAFAKFNVKTIALKPRRVVGFSA